MESLCVDYSIDVPRYAELSPTYYFAIEVALTQKKTHPYTSSYSNRLI
jgi:hypothetical protein